jgi:hypothetical protein
MRTCVHHGEEYLSAGHYRCTSPEIPIRTSCDQPPDVEHPPCFVPLLPAPAPARTPLDVDCSRCGVVAGEPCRSLSGKKKGQPLPEGTFHDERIYPLEPAEPETSAGGSWGDEIEDDEEVG